MVTLGIQEVRFTSVCVLMCVFADSQDILYLGDNVFGTGALLFRGLLVFRSIDVNLGKLVLS